jgi:hypothetical protein
MAVHDHGLEAIRKASSVVTAGNTTEYKIRTFDVGNMLGGVAFDAIDIQQTSATVETFVFKTGGLAGTTVKTITVTYTDSTKADLDTVVAT